MASTSETGHAKNAANFQKLIEQVKVYTQYNPSVNYLKIANLQTLYDNAKAKLADVEEVRRDNKNAITLRQTAFEDLKGLTTRIINFLDILGLPEGTMEQGKSIKRIIHGNSKKPAAPQEEGKETPKNVSTSRQSFTQQAENFGTLITMLESIPEYTPNEDDLKIVNLKSYHASLESTTLAVDQTESVINAKFQERDVLLYDENSGLVNTAQNIKKYVKTIYGAQSTEYNDIAGIKFTEK